VSSGCPRHDIPAIPEQAQSARQSHTQRHIAITQRPFQDCADIVQFEFEPLTPVIVTRQPQLRFGLALPGRRNTRRAVWRIVSASPLSSNRSRAYSWIISSRTNGVRLPGVSFCCTRLLSTRDASRQVHQWTRPSPHTASMASSERPPRKTPPAVQTTFFILIQQVVAPSDRVFQRSMARRGITCTTCERT
jgi:hypothetical protein